MSGLLGKSEGDVCLLKRFKNAGLRECLPVQNESSQVGGCCGGVDCLRLI